MELLPAQYKLMDSDLKQRGLGVLTKNEQKRFSMNWKSFLLIAVLPFLSGAAALSHELLWTRRLVDLLGATDWVIGRVLGLFFLGLSVGGYLATLQVRSKMPAIKRLVIAELSIGLLALPAAFLPFWTDWIWSAMGTDALVSWQGAATKFVIAFIVVIPPSIAMGFTLPLFIKSTTDLGSEVASVGIWVYALNTIGGVFGLWFTSTFLTLQLGAQWTMLTIAAANALVAITVWILMSASRHSEPSSVDNDSIANELANSPRAKELTQPDTSSPSRWQLVAMSFLSGFIILSLEILLLRLTSLVVPSSYHTTSALLANVILILGLSSLLISGLNSHRFTRKIARSRWLVSCAFFAAAILISFCPAVLYSLTNKLVSIRYLQSLNGLTIESISHYWWLVFGLVAGTGGFALLFSGLVFPSLLTMSSDGDPSGSRIGILLAANGIGGLLGSELCNSIVLTTFGIYQGFWLLAFVPLVAGAVLLMNTNRTFTLAITMVVGFVLLWPSRNGELPYLSPRTTKAYKIISTQFGTEGALIITEKPMKNGGTSKSILVNNQYVLGGSGATLDQRRQLLLPWILNPDAKEVCCLGLATGISASGLEQVPNPPSVTAVELSEMVAQLAHKHFGNATNGFFDRKNNRVVIEDARTYMAAADNQYDLIAGDLYRPHGAGEGRLFTVEHFQNTRRSLTEGGIFVQWLPAYQMNEENFLIIAATFQKVFPETLIAYGNLDAQHPVIGLFGRRDDKKWNVKDLTARLKAIDSKTLERDPLMKSASGLIVGVIKKDALKDQMINTLDNLQIELRAGNFWILKDLRKGRKGSMETEFLSGRYVIPFNQRLEQITDPIFPRDYFRRFNQAIQSKLQAR